MINQPFNNQHQPTISLQITDSSFFAQPRCEETAEWWTLPWTPSGGLAMACPVEPQKLHLSKVTWGKWTIYRGLTYEMVIFYSYVELPKGTNLDMTPWPQELPLASCSMELGSFRFFRSGEQHTPQGFIMIHLSPKPVAGAGWLKIHRHTLYTIIWILAIVLIVLSCQFWWSASVTKWDPGHKSGKPPS